jgi:choline monooxygenase
MSRFFVDPDIAKASTLSTTFYTDPAFYEEAKEKIFAKSWQFAGDAALAAEPGQCRPFMLLENYLDEPLVLTRDNNGSPHILSNVCTHRGNIVVNEPCRVTNLRCRYHGRQFRHDGNFVSMPEFKEVKNFPTVADNLTKMALYQWGPWLFTSINPEHSFQPFLQHMMDRLHWLPVNEFVLEPQLSKDYLVKAHWALYCENYLEGFHIPFVHAGLNAVIDFGNYTTELFTWSNLQLGIAKDDDDIFDLPASSPDYGKRVAAYYFFVFPNMMFNFYPWGLSINIVQPQSIGSCKVSFLTYSWKKDKLNRGAGADLDTVEHEDEEVVEAVQQGIRSRFYTHGRYSVTREQGTHHFHRMIAEFMDKEQ